MIFRRSCVWCHVTRLQTHADTGAARPFRLNCLGVSAQAGRTAVRLGSAATLGKENYVHVLVAETFLQGVWRGAPFRRSKVAGIVHTCIVDPGLPLPNSLYILQVYGSCCGESPLSLRPESNTGCATEFVHCKYGFLHSRWRSKGLSL